MNAVTQAKLVGYARQVVRSYRRYPAQTTYIGLTPYDSNMTSEVRDELKQVIIDLLHDEGYAPTLTCQSLSLTHVCGMSSIRVEYLT